MKLDLHLVSVHDVFKKGQMHNLEFKKDQFSVFIKTISKHNSRNVRITRAALLKEVIIICLSNCPRIM